MVGNPYRYRAALRQLDNRHATAGCLLAVLFLVPFAARVYHVNMTILLLAASLYAVVVVPLITGYITCGSIFRIVLYFLVSEKAFCPEQKCVSLYALLFCTMLAYLYQSLQTRRWSQIMFTTTTADFLRLTTTFIILRLGKGVAMSFVLITITLQFDDLEPCAPFIITTTLYFIITQFLKNPKDNILVTAVRYMDLYIFEGLEEYWIPLLMNSLAILLSIINIIIALNQDSGNIVLCMVVMYTNVIIAFQQLQEECIEPFKEQLKLLERFPLATKEQMAQRGDTTCPVCLDEMNFLTARITPCRHIFHGQCLRQCVLQYQQCPMCKQSL
ncbi:Protein TRC8 homolog [Gryllus bimaculatus]|nr:Protein TRC8 homolog [Gryllus bimaculatus]